MDQVELSMLVDIGLKFYAVPSRPTCVTLRSMSLVIDFNRFSGKAQVRRAFIEQTVGRMGTTSCTGQCNLVLLYSF